MELLTKQVYASFIYIILNITLIVFVCSFLNHTLTNTVFFIAGLEQCLFH